MEKKDVFVLTISLVCILAAVVSASVVTPPPEPGSAEVTTEPTSPPPNSTSQGSDLNISEDISDDVNTGVVNQPYWRVTSYDTYTGSGWKQTELGSKIDGSEEGRETLEQTVRVLSDVDVAPGAWKPAKVTSQSNGDVDHVARGLEASSLRKGSTYTVESEVSDVTEDELRESWTPKESKALEKYRQLPDDTPEKIRELASRITANASSDYGAVIAIEGWLKTNKDYSTQVGKTSSSIAHTFVFDMDSGYCEYYATAMVVMLRTQNIPARYVVGYAPGEKDDSSWKVRGGDAHAWVEVYFDDYGWVKFDPTPSEPREEARETTETSRDVSVGVEEISYSPRSVDQRDSPDLQSDNLSISVKNGPVVPGKEIMVVVRSDGSPLGGAVVEFNGEQVGVTDVNGEVEGEVPYEEELTITASLNRNQNEKGETEKVGTEGDGFGGASSGEVNLRKTDRTNTVGGIITGFSDELLFEITAEGYEAAYPASDTVSSSRGVVGYTPRNRPSYKLTDYERSDRKPTNYGFSEHQDQEEDNDSTASKTYYLDTQIEIDVVREEPDRFEIKATIDDVPVEGADVYVDDKKVGETDSEGRVILENVEGEAEVTIKKEEAEGGVFVGKGNDSEDGIPGLPIYLGLTFLFILGYTGVYYHRNSELPYENGTQKVIEFSENTADDLEKLMNVTKRTLSGLSILAPGNIIYLMGKGLLKIAVKAPSGLSSLSEAFSGLGSLLSRDSEDQRSRTTTETRRGIEEDIEESERADTNRVYLVWKELRNHVSPVRIKSRTPAEIARQGIRKGFPKKHVLEITTTFRKVRYGGVEPDDGIEQRIEESIDEIEEELEAEDGDGDDEESNENSETHGSDREWSG